MSIIVGTTVGSSTKQINVAVKTQLFSPVWDSVALSHPSAELN